MPTEQNETVIQTKWLATIWKMGLSGKAFTVANMSAIGLLCLMFYQDRHEVADLAREDRVMFREELRTLHADAKNAQGAILKIAASVESLAAEIKQIKNQTQELEKERAKNRIGIAGDDTPEPELASPIVKPAGKGDRPKG
jgi:hypothetical protein